MIIWKGKLLVRSAESPDPVAVNARALPSTVPLVRVTAHVDAEVAASILDVDDERAALAALAPVASGAVFRDIMLDLGRYDAGLRAAIVRAIALERWSNRYRFCPACGMPLVWSTDETAKICTDRARVHRHFPRLDPAIIVLVTSGDRALLSRAARYPPGFYSTLAGFVEPGESVEAAVRREVDEEAGIVVGATRYFGSESWPFPRSLMLGFFAEARSIEITLRDAELEDARWFERDELARLQARMKRERPFFDTIARRMIDTWLAQGTAS